MSYSEKLIGLIARNLSSTDKRSAALIRAWKKFRKDHVPEPAIGLACELISDRKVREVELGFHVLMAIGLADATLRCHLAELASHRLAGVRRDLAFYLGRDFPQDFRAKIYRHLLQDKAESVRIQAIRMIGMSAATWMLPDLGARQSLEKNEKVLERLNYWIPLLQSGYRVDPTHDPTGLQVTVLTGHGISSMPLETTDFCDPRIPGLVDELRKYVQGFMRPVIEKLTGAPPEDFS